MASSYLVEAGTDHYQLEDGSGNYTLEPFVAVAYRSPAPTSSLNTFTVTIPAATAVGDLLVLVATAGNPDVFTTPTGVTGWTERANTGATTLSVAVWTKVCEAGDPGANVTVTRGITNIGTAMVLVLSSDFSFDVITAPVEDLTDQAFIRTPSDVTPTSNDELLMVIGGGRSLDTTDPTRNFTISPPTNYATAAQTSTAISSASQNVALFAAIRQITGGAGVAQSIGTAATTQTLTYATATSLAFTAVTATAPLVKYRNSNREAVHRSFRW